MGKRLSLKHQNSDQAPKQQLSRHSQCHRKMYRATSEVTSLLSWDAFAAFYLAIRGPIRVLGLGNLLLRWTYGSLVLLQGFGY
ncbi:conserved hypothetical protein [Ricinus communis]|uniref:Uncharacterized protein n=1 Tax=Ricinus communis TaxID=3988 RepID=B9RFH5_RICCO|nr:conserved hypothetical protein [Ricinus communis]